jgi:hypothetical protein
MVRVDLNTGSVPLRYQVGYRPPPYASLRPPCGFLAQTALQEHRDKVGFLFGQIKQRGAVLATNGHPLRPR